LRKLHRSGYRDWLKPDGTGRRTWEKAPKKYVKPKQIFEIIQRRRWEYRRTPDLYHSRDLALAALLYLTSGRINEVLRLTRDQFIQDETDPRFLICSSFWVSKRKKGKQHPVKDIPLPREGAWAPFTRTVEEYISQLGPNEKLFKIGTVRAYAIIQHITKLPASEEKGYWCHWFRSQSLSYQVNLLRSTQLVASDRGIESPQTLSHYYVGDWKGHKEEMLK